MISVANPPGRFESVHVSWEDGEAPPARLRLYDDATRAILSHNDSPDLGFSWSVNPYRGCSHACAYCYARAFHEYLGWGAGTDFETRILVKRDAPELLRQAFDRPSWRGELVAFCGVTDGWQPLEARLGLTRACLEVCAAYRNPVAIVTRSAVIERDVDLLVALHREASVAVTLSIPVAERALCRALEPGAPTPARRLQAVRTLAEAGVPVGVSVAPVIPGLTEAGVPELLERAREAGASWAWRSMVRLSPSVREVFAGRLRAVAPLRAEAVLARVERQADQLGFGERMEGRGASWEAFDRLFELSCRRLGLRTSTPPAASPTPFRRPGHGRQLSLFGT